VVGCNFVAGGEPTVELLKEAAADPTEAFESVSADLFVIANIKRVCTDFASSK
jgi:hypothetical protein